MGERSIYDLPDGLARAVEGQVDAEYGRSLWLKEHRELVAPELGPVFDSIEQLPDASIRHAGRTLGAVAVFQARGLRVWPPPG